MNHIRKLIIKHSGVIIYFVFGVLTTLVNFLVYFPLYNWLHFSATFSNILAWIVAVIFAFLTNKPFVFKSHDWSSRTVIPELTKFVSCRLASGAAETLILLVSVDIMGWNGNIWKLVTQFLVLVMNYIGSKFLVFRNKS